MTNIEKWLVGYSTCWETSMTGLGDWQIMLVRQSKGSMKKRIKGLGTNCWHFCWEWIVYWNIRYMNEHKPELKLLVLFFKCQTMVAPLSGKVSSYTWCNLPATRIDFFFLCIVHSHLWLLSNQLLFLASPNFQFSLFLTVWSLFFIGKAS